MNVVVLMQNDAVLGVYSSEAIAKAFAYKHYNDHYSRPAGRRFEDLNYRYLGFTVNSETFMQ